MKTEYIKPETDLVDSPAEELCADLLGESTFQTSENDPKIRIKDGVPDPDEGWTSAKDYWAWDDAWENLFKDYDGPNL